MIVPGNLAASQIRWGNPPDDPCNPKDDLGTVPRELQLRF